jgi:MoaA/NifB/PqqE/SkfB family radical SAM enzyme
MDKKQFTPIYKKFTNSDVRGTAEEHIVWYISEYLDKEYGFNLHKLINDATGKENYKDTYTENLRNEIPKNFCLYPFTHFQLDPDGRARPCCKYKVGDPTWQKDVPKLPDVDIGELWEQEEFQNLRDQFLRNERPSGCKACWDEEAAGIKSMRLQREEGGQQHPWMTFFNHIPRPYPKSLDLKLSNLCNLKCRICTPFLSTQWMKEIIDLKVNDMGDVKTFTRNSREKFSENPSNEEILKQWAPTIDYLEFYGGEPLMQQEHDKILRIMNEHGKPEHTGLYYNTNGTICDEEFFKLWAPFREVTMNFSIDDIGTRFEFQRKNAVWNETLENMVKYKELAAKYNVNMTIRLYTTVGILNVFYLNEFFEFVKKHDMKVLLNLVHYPHHYSIVNLPAEIKDVIKEKLLSIDTNGYLAEWSPTIDNIINFMYGAECDVELLKTFFHKTRIHDEYRNESFSDTFPELYELLKQYEN